jgi:2-amino-4-hydroxy-6-hydroxymethyldihydropteridine diphosphokinase
LKVGASLADQLVAAIDGTSTSLAIALGANLGDPLATLVAVRPLLERIVAETVRAAGLPADPLRSSWSPLFRTAPVGGPPGQPTYLNAVLVAAPVGPGASLNGLDPLLLLEQLQILEHRFGRQRHERWGPRHLDLDLLWCGAVHCRTPGLELPHPRLLERGFVLAPLAAIDPGLIPPGGSTPAAKLLAALLLQPGETAPAALPGRSGWPEHRPDWGPNADPDAAPAAP